MRFSAALQTEPRWLRHGLLVFGGFGSFQTKHFSITKITKPASETELALKFALRAFEGIPTPRLGPADLKLINFFFFLNYI